MIMSNSNDKCQQLRELKSHLIEELRILRQNLEEEEQEGVVNPIETVNIIESLQKTLSSVNLELQKCPDTK
jgi:flagellar biosynthesis/type III secretory pathway chaperone